MIGFVGLSHLGLNYSLATAAKGFDVVAYDPDTELIRRLEAGDFPIEEPGFSELHERHHSKLRYTSAAADLGSCDLVFYSLDVRTNAGNESDLGPLTALIQKRIMELMDGARPLVDRGNMTDLQVVIEEILQDKIAIDYAASGLDEPGVNK